MRTLHDPSIRASIRQRLLGLRPDAPRQWGRMTVDQMLWHVNTALEQSLGRFTATPRRVPVPGGMLKFLVLNLPWGKGAPTNPDFLARAEYDFEEQRARSVTLVDEVAGRDIDGAWPENTDFGRMTGREWSRLMAKHLDHHLRQFGA
jgi:hypothetical protein